MAATAAAETKTAAAADTVVLSVHRSRRKRVGRQPRPLQRPSLYFVDDSNDTKRADHRQSRFAVSVMPATADTVAAW